jgi:hypothetical protein
MLFICRLDGEVYKIAGPEAQKHFHKVDNYKVGGEGWTYVLPRDFVSIFPVITREAFSCLKYATMNPETTGVLHGDTKLDNFFFYNEAAELGGAGAAGLLDWQLMVQGDTTQDVAYFLSSSCSPNFQEEHEAELLDLYFTELAVCGGPTVHPGSEDRTSWEESYVERWWCTRMLYCSVSPGMRHSW